MSTTHAGCFFFFFLCVVVVVVVSVLFLLNGSVYFQSTNLSGMSIMYMCFCVDVLERAEETGEKKKKKEILRIFFLILFLCEKKNKN